MDKPVAPWQIGVLFALAATIASNAATGKSNAPQIFPLEKVKTGQTGYGLTVFRGVQPERFTFEVLGVMRKSLPNQDLILVRSDDAKIKQVGWAQGMSGSPLFIDGKVACAFSYGYPYSKGNIGACTPISYMLDVAQRPRQASPKPLAIAPQAAPQLLAMFGVAPRAGKSLPPVAAAAGQLTRATLPLGVSGLGPHAMVHARDLFEPLGIAVTQGGGAGGQNPSRVGNGEYVMGGAIAAQLARGDIAMAATGTVSYISGDQVLAFGHPFFELGEIQLPAAEAEIHAVIPSVNMAFKVASPLNEIGSMVQDRQAAILVDASRKSAMIPLRVRVKYKKHIEDVHVEVVNHQSLTPIIAGIVLGNAAKLAAPDVSPATVRIRSALHVRGIEKVFRFDERLFSPAGPGPALSSSRAMQILGPLLANPFAKVWVDRIELDAQVTFDRNYMDVESIHVPTGELRVGKNRVAVRLRGFNHKRKTKYVEVEVPETLAGATLRLQATSGTAAPIRSATPANIQDVYELLRALHPSGALVVTVYTPERGIQMNGKLFPDLPGSAMDAAISSARTNLAAADQSFFQTVVEPDFVVRGKVNLTVRVSQDN